LEKVRPVGEKIRSPTGNNKLQMTNRREFCPPNAKKKGCDRKFVWGAFACTSSKKGKNRSRLPPNRRWCERHPVNEEIAAEMWGVVGFRQ